MKLREKVSAVLKEKNKPLHRIIKVVYFFLAGLGEMNPLVYNCKSWTSSKLIRWLLKVIVSPYYIIDYFRYKDTPGRKGLAFVLIAKNEAPYIEEWLNFHVKQGVSHFLIYDNESTDNIHEVLEPYIASGLVTYHTILGKSRQEDAYNMAIYDYGYKFKYMAFIDADEFLFVRKNTYTGGGISSIYDYLNGFMAAHPKAGSLVVNWCMFGSSGHITKPAGSVLENYTHRAPDNYYRHHTFKSICDPAKVWAFSNSAHSPVCRSSFRNLSEDGTPALGSTTYDIHFRTIRINHYFIKSREEFLAKRARGRNSIIPLPLSEFEKQDRNEVTDTEILSRV